MVITSSFRFLYIFGGFGLLCGTPGTPRDNKPVNLLYLKMSHFSVYVFPSKTSGAIHAALPLLLVMTVCISQAVPKSQIFNIKPCLTSSKLGDLRSL